MRRPRTLNAVVAEGDHLASLKAIAGKVARTMDAPETEPHSISGLARELVDVLERIEEHKPPEVSVVDEIGAQRDKRLAEIPARPAGSQ